jgi:ribonuclease G
MSKEMIITSSAQETKVAILEDDLLSEIHIERSQEQGLVGSIYKGRVTKVLPGMQSAFVNVGLERDAFLYVSDFFEEAEDNDSIVAAVEDKIEKLESSSSEEPGFFPSPAVIEIPTIREYPVVVAAVPQLRTQVPPPIGESAVTTQPLRVVESPTPDSAVEKGTTAAGDSGARPRSEYDRRGRYGRRRGRRRPWENRHEQQRAVQTPPAHTAPPAPPVAATVAEILPPPPPAVISMLTPLPGESLSKFQQVSSETMTTQAPEANAAIQPGTGAEPAREAIPEATTALEATVPTDLHETMGFRAEVHRVEAQHETTLSGISASESHTAIPAPPEPEAVVSSPHAGAILIPQSPAEDSAPQEQPAHPAWEVEPSPWPTAAPAMHVEPEAIPFPRETAVAHSETEATVALEKIAAAVEEVKQPGGASLNSAGQTPGQQVETQTAEAAREIAAVEPVPLAGEKVEMTTPSPVVEPVVTTSPEPVAIEGSRPEVTRAPVSEIPSVTPILAPLRVQPAAVSPAPETSFSKPQPEAPPKPAQRPGFDRRDFRKPRFEEKRSESRTEPAPPPPAPKAEVYGPPTPYQYMTNAEKVEYKARLAVERVSARIQDSSRKMTAPQPRERDYGHQRGRRGRRGRKRFGESEPQEQAPAREEKKPSQRPLIADLLREGQEILVQIAKEPLGKKGARITSHIALPGRYLVYMPTVDHIGVSRKISTDEERHRLKRILNEYRAGLSGGFIVRTAGEGRTEEELKQDIRFLASTWADIRSRAEKRAAPALLHRDLGVLERILRDQLSSDFKAIRLDNETEYAKVVEFVHQFQPGLVGRVKLHLKDTPIFEEHGIDHEIEKALKPKVWLKSGGYIVINQTEAMVAIDVNTGKFVGKTTRLEDTIVKTNIDAAKEVARQIRLRDMGGIIVIDFIDMEERKNRAKVIQSLEEAMHSDRAPYKILAFNDFGLVALTRKRVKQSLEKTLLTSCSYCQGQGMIKSIQTVCLEIQTEAKKMAHLLDGREIRVRVHPEIAKALKTSEQAVISEIEGHTRKEVVIKTDPQIHQDQYDIF